MLRIKLLTIGREKAGWVKTGCDHYLKLLGGYARVEHKALPAAKSSASLSPPEVQAREALTLAKHIEGYLIVLHDRGQTFDSPAFAKLVEQLQVRAGGRITMVIGGAFGLDRELLKRADMQLSLSPMTFPHELTRLMLLEQLYRAYSILANTSYHK